MEEEVILETKTRDNDFKILRKGNQEGGIRYTLKISGRVNCEVPIQYPGDLFLHAMGASHLNTNTLLLYALRGEFYIVEEGKKYIVRPSEDPVYWHIITEKQEPLARVEEKVLLDIILGKPVDEILREVNKVEEMSEEYEKLLSSISDMLSSGKFNRDVYMQAIEYSERTGDERIKDLLRIVKRIFRHELQNLEPRF